MNRRVIEPELCQSVRNGVNLRRKTCSRVTGHPSKHDLPVRRSDEYNTLRPRQNLTSEPVQVRSKSHECIDIRVPDRHHIRQAKALVQGERGRTVAVHEMSVNQC